MKWPGCFPLGYGLTSMETILEKKICRSTPVFQETKSLVTLSQKKPKKRENLKNQVATRETRARLDDYSLYLLF